MEILALTSWYQHWYCKILYIPYKNKEKKNKTVLTNTTLVLIYLAQVALCYNYSFNCDTFFFSAIYPEESIDSLVRKVWIFEAPIHQHFEKIFAKKSFGNFSVKHPFCSPKFKQKTCKRKRAQETLGVYRSAQVRSHASYDKVWISYTLFLDQRHICGSMEMKNIRRFYQISYVVNKLMRLIVSILVFTLIFHCLIS